MQEKPNLYGEYAVLAEKIKFMASDDQDMRKRALDNNGFIENEEDSSLDKRNTEEMKKIIKEIGWPTISKVGADVANKAWLLVQHADHDVVFQEGCLVLMKECSAGEVDDTNIAYLEDRVKVNKGQLQIYGTQFFGEGKDYRPRPIEDAENVDSRRKIMGLETLEEYKSRLVQKYYKFDKN